jgi:hypothetical protein
VRARHDLDAQAVRIEQVRGVVARAVVVAWAGRAVVGAAGSQGRLVGGVDGGTAAGGESDVAEARRRPTAAGDDPQPRVVDAVADALGRVEDPPPAQRVEERVAIARALARRPALLLMDEPFGALDEMTRERMQSELIRLCAETGAAVVFVTHSIPEAVFLSQRVVVISPRPGAITEIVDVPLGTRDEDVREAEQFFAAITDVREALRGRTVVADEGPR